MKVKSIKGFKSNGTHIIKVEYTDGLVLEFGSMAEFVKYADEFDKIEEIK